MKLNYFYSYFYALKKIKKQGGKLEKDGWVVNKSFCLPRKNLYFLPIIKKVNGDFYVSDNNIKILNNIPKEINGIFDISHNQIESIDIILKEKPKINGILWYGNPLKNPNSVIELFKLIKTNNEVKFHIKDFL